MDFEPRGRARDDRGQFSLLVRQIRPYWRRFLVAILLGVAASTLSLLQPALIASMVTALENSTGILPSVLLLLALLTTSAALSGFQTYALGTLGEQVTGRIRMTYVRAVLRLPVCALEAYRRADLVARATSDTTLLRVALTEGAGQIIGGVIMFVGALIAMAFVSPLLLLATVVTVTIGLVCVMALSGRLRNASTQVQEGVSSLGSSLDQSIFASKTIRSLNAADWAISRVDRTIDAAKQAGIRFARVSSAVTPLSGVVMQLCLAVVLGLGAFQVANGTLPVAQLVAFVMYVFLLLTPVGQAVRAMTSLSQATAAARRLAEVEEEAEAPEERSGRGKAQATSVSGPTPVPEANDACAVEFADVHFAYPATGGGATAGEPKPALRGVTFAVPPGAKVGIVGLGQEHHPQSHRGFLLAAEGIRPHSGNRRGLRSGCAGQRAHRPRGTGRPGHRGHPPRQPHARRPGDRRGRLPPGAVTREPRPPVQSRPRRPRSRTVGSGDEPVRR